MENVKRILAVSGMTEGCRKAVHAGASLAKTYGAELLVVHLVSRNPFELTGGDVPVDTIEHDYEPYLRDAQEHLQEVLAAAGASDLPVRQLAKFGNPADEVSKIVQEEGIDLLVLLGHPRGRVEHYVLERGVDELVRRLPCSILLVRE